MPARRIACGLGGLLLALGIGTTAATAATAFASSTVNVRSGAGTGYAVVDVLRPGQRVEIDYCRGLWCVVQQSGPDGWVNANYLTAEQYDYDDGYDYDDEEDDGYDYFDSDGYVFGRRGFADDYAFDERPRPFYRPLYPVRRTHVCWGGYATTLCFSD